MADRANNITKAFDISGIEYICFNTGQGSLHQQYYYLDCDNQFSLENCQLQSYHIVIQSPTAHLACQVKVIVKGNGKIN